MNAFQKIGTAALLLAVAFASVASVPAASAAETTEIGATAATSQLPVTPVVVFPAFHFTKLRAFVFNQTVAPDCPSFGYFEDWFLNDKPSKFFSQECQDELLTLVYDADPSKPMAQRFSNQPGVFTHIASYGRTESAPFYEPLYQFLESHGWVRNQSIRVAGYDSRLTPDMDGFLPRTMHLIELTYHQNGQRPVHLVGHSNGPLYAQYLLTHTPQWWKDKYIHGFTPLAGNWPGQGLLYPVFFIGLNVIDFHPPTDPAQAASSATMYLSHPSSYMSSADPDIFGDFEVVVRDLSTGTDYTPKDYPQLFADAGLPVAGEIAAHYIGFVEFARQEDFPNVDVYAEKGSGFETLVGLELDDLSVGQVFDGSNGVFTRPDGDANQEDVTNDSILVWQDMECFDFSLVDNPGVDHFALASDPAVLGRLLAHLQQPRSVCP